MNKYKNVASANIIMILKINIIMQWQHQCNQIIKISPFTDLSRLTTGLLQTLSPSNIRLSNCRFRPFAGVDTHSAPFTSAERPESLSRLTPNLITRFVRLLPTLSAINTGGYGRCRFSCPRSVPLVYIVVCRANHSILSLWNLPAVLNLMILSAIRVYIFYLLPNCHILTRHYISINIRHLLFFALFI